MKKTTKILIGMTILPFALLILAWVALMAFGSKISSESSHESIEDEKIVEVAATGAFSRVRVVDKRGHMPNAKVTIRKTDKHGILASKSLADDIKWEIADGLLTVTFDPEGPTEFYNAHIDICTPSLTESAVGDALVTRIRGFEADSVCVSPGIRLEIADCRYQAMLIDNNSGKNLRIKCKSSHIDRLNIDGGRKIYFIDPHSSSIATLAWQPGQGAENPHIDMTGVKVENFAWLGPQDDIDNLSIFSTGHYNFITKQ